ncbi:hypothetical protein DUZ99_13050 [Xylanibacillus composti]|uniref:Aminoacyl-tRNA synthetase class II (G/ P/ S/T) domain-containing protein n=1 Tax=Xylanibacillus composti TaxID=1572762 RepID=A0A8J4M4K5_9BACL|nr:aminoacyl--tRNA ligase-related protein [Xylanibacillus composti]MDT9725901.1 hypothetical protein [Xylanibacillus composti]GIQ71270.1 hypothetical protein XYCOK13_40940 [Xylanibacillus composti]
MRLEVDCPVTHAEVKKTLQYQLRFYFPEITSVTFQDNQRVVLESETPLPEQKVKASIEKSLRKFARINERIQSKVLFDSDSDQAQAYTEQHAPETLQASFLESVDSLLQQLQAGTGRMGEPMFGEQTYKVRPGLNVYANETAVVLDALDRFFMTVLQKAFHAEEMKPPSMISSSVVDRAGYFKTGCQHISFVSPISNDPEVFDEFLPFWSDASDENGICHDERLRQYTKVPKDILTPAICLHSYPLFENRKIESGEMVTLSMSGSVFRDESGNLNNEERLNEFKMREGIFFGARDKLIGIHPGLVALFVMCGHAFGFRYKIETANDIFFDENAMQQLLSQLVSDNKIELSVYSEEKQKYIAIASLNKHHQHFSKNFNINDTNDQPVDTMCIAFGLSRFVYLMMERVKREGLHAFTQSLLAKRKEIDSWNGVKEWKPVAQLEG